MGEEREVFGSRMAFYFAAVGSAVGFGNVWRFPGLAYKFGGGAFFIPYLMALILIGIPVLCLEISLGQYYQRGDVSVFGGIHKRMRGVGLISVSCGYVLFTYYSMLITWVVRTLFESGTAGAPWGDDTVTSSASYKYFLDEMIGMKYLEGSKIPTQLVWQNVLTSIFVYVVVFLCSAFGLKLTGKITYVTMGLPVLLLFIFLIRGAALEGSSDGVRAYIGTWDLSILSERGEIWSEAVSQIFFSLSVTFGVMTAYGSHMKRDEPAFMNSLVVALANTMFSFLAGFAVFSAIGHKAFQDGVDISEVENLSSFGLVFGTWPVVLGSLPGGIHWIRLLFVNLFLLGIDSAFSFIEALVTCAQDTAKFRNTPKWLITAVFCGVGFLLSLLYATDAGLNFLDVVDWYVNFVMLFVGFLECFTVGWIYGIEEKLDQFGPAIFFSYLVTTFGSVVFASALWFGLEQDATLGGFLGLVLFYAMGMAGVVYLLVRKESDESIIDQLKELTFGNMCEFKEKLEPVIGYIPWIWCILIKHFIPQVLLILFVNLACSKNDVGETNLGHYGGYAMRPYQALGIFVIVLSVAVFLVGLFAPDVYDPFISYYEVTEGAGDVEETKAEFPVKKLSEVEAEAVDEGQ